MLWFHKEAPTLSPQSVDDLALRLLDEARSRICAEPRRVLLLPPDQTRAHSGAGRITETLYRALSPGCDVHVIPTLGQHAAHTSDENRQMFGSIPNECIHAHDWMDGVTPIGVIPASVVAEKTHGAADWEIPVDLNKDLMTGGWDLIVNIGQVVPHEVLGFSNHNKNYFIGLGGKRTISAAHLASAVCGIENNLGRLLTPLRDCFNWAEERFLAQLPHVYFQIVMRNDERGGLQACGIYAGADNEVYRAAARQSSQQNVTILPKAVQKVVAVMRGDEYRSTWVANKAIYRTRLAIATGGELLIIAPGLQRFGEQISVDRLIRKYGYMDMQSALKMYRENADLQDLALVVAHLFYGSSEGRFTIRYAPGLLAKEEIESVGYQYADLKETLARYDPARMKESWNKMPDGEEVFFIGTPSIGLWSAQDKLVREESP